MTGAGSHVEDGWSLLGKQLTALSLLGCAAELMRAGSAVEAKDAGVRLSWVGGSWSEYETPTVHGMPRWLEEKLRKVFSLSSPPPLSVPSGLQRIESA